MVLEEEKQNVGKDQVIVGVDDGIVLKVEEVLLFGLKVKYQ